MPHGRTGPNARDGTAQFNLALAREVRIGEAAVGDPVIAFPDAAGVKKQPTLGLNILSRFPVLVDFPAQKLYLQPRRGDSRTVHHRNLSALTMLQR